MFYAIHISDQGCWLFESPLPRPPGYCLFELCLESVEFWGNGTERLHERLRYDRDEGGWKHRYLQP
ncbi:putative pyridoxamine 5'-phosphate oxidase [Pseudomonas aeruginosa VRFPA02]|nr:putative pyridoxamine 5'-phosphate oxidase [Pseudomonas aeruginosa VRFPA02]